VAETGLATNFNITLRKSGILTATLRESENGPDVIKLITNRSVKSGKHTLSFGGKLKNSKPLTPNRDYFLSLKLTVGKVTHTRAYSFPVIPLRPRLTSLKCAKLYYPDLGKPWSAGFKLQTGGEVYAELNNAKGLTVAILADALPMSAGANTLSWSGTDADGNYLKTGKYTMKLYYISDDGARSPGYSLAFQYDAPPVADGAPTSIWKQLQTPITVFRAGYLTQCYARTTPGGRAYSDFTFGTSAGLRVLEKGATHSKVQFNAYRNSRLVTGYVSNTEIKQLAPSSPYGVVVDKRLQKAFVYRSGILIKSYSVSTGASGMATPSGEFIIPNRKPGFSSGALRARFAVRVIGRIYFHEIPHLNGNYKPYESQLGRPASHGCIRQPRSVAKWFYDTVPDGTKVIIK